MYTHCMIRIYRSPEGGEGGGTSDNGAAAGADPGAAAGAGAAESGAAGGSAPQYATKADLDAIASRFEQTLRSHRPAKEPEAKSDGLKELKRPNPKDYDFKGDPEALQRYEDDLDEYRYQIRKGKEAKEREESDKKAAQEKNERGHLERVREYKKQNPTFDADAQKAGNIQVYDDVKRVIFASKNSASVLHYLFQNPGAADDLNILAQTEGPEAVREQIGEYAAAMRQKKEQLGSAEAAARVRPPRQNLRGGSASGERKISLAERFERHNS